VALVKAQSVQRALLEFRFYICFDQAEKIRLAEIGLIRRAMHASAALSANTRRKNAQPDEKTALLYLGRISGF